MGTAHPRRIAVPSEGRSGRPQANLASGLLSRRSARARRARAVVRGACVALGARRSVSSSRLTTSVLRDYVGVLWIVSLK